MTATASSERVRCRNQRCRSKLPVPTANEHKAFCTPYCYSQFYSWKCKVCENPIQKGRRRKVTDHCHDRRCRRDFRRYPDAFSYHRSHISNYGSRSAHFTGVKSALKSDRAPAWVQIAGPPIDPINLMIPLEPVFAARLGKMHCQLLEKVRHDAEEKALLKRHHPPVNIVGGYRFPIAPEIELSLADPVKAEDHDFGNLSIPDFLRRPING
jgi:hypothetical protein